MKQKSHSGAKKRTKLTGRKKSNGSGKLMFGNACKRHLLTNKSKKAKKRNSKGKEASASFIAPLKRLLGLK